MLVTLALLAIVDIVVGVSNDAINFLNSAFLFKHQFESILVEILYGRFPKITNLSL